MNDRGAWGRLALVVIALLLVILSFLPLWETDRWWVRQWDYPRLQVTALLLVAAAALYVVRLAPRYRWSLLALIGAALAWQASHFLAYLPPYPKQVASVKSCPPGRQVSLLNANVLLSNQEHAKLLKLIEERQPDVLLLLEPGAEWEKAVQPLASSYPYRLSQALPNTYGMILMSRLPMRGAIVHLLQPGVPSAHVWLQLAGGQQVILHALHPEPPLPGDDSGERDAELVEVGRMVRNDGRASIVMGDLNDVAWSRTSQLFRKVAGMGDPRIGRGFYPTFDANYPLLRWPLDYLFVSPHFKLIAIDVLPDIGSDHFPIFFRLCLNEDAAERKVSPSAGPATEAQASEELEEGVAENREEESGH